VRAKRAPASNPRTHPASGDLSSAFARAGRQPEAGRSDDAQQAIIIRQAGRQPDGWLPCRPAAVCRRVVARLSSLRFALLARVDDR
jgi:hypothetical protein